MFPTKEWPSELEKCGRFFAEGAEATAGDRLTHGP